MIHGDQQLITKKGISISNQSMSAIGLYPDSQAFMLLFRTYEYREAEISYHFPYNFYISPISPTSWPFVFRFAVRLSSKPGALLKLFTFLKKEEFNVLTTETSRAGHHHEIVNVIAESNKFKSLSLKKFAKEIMAIKGKHEETIDDIPQWLDILQNYSNIADEKREDIIKGKNALLKEYINKLKEIIDEPPPLAKMDKNELKDELLKIEKKYGENKGALFYIHRLLNLLEELETIEDQKSGGLKRLFQSVCKVIVIVNLKNSARLLF
jgi:hypothetical protein